jgi:hypothetical protein
MILHGFMKLGRWSPRRDFWLWSDSVEVEGMFACRLQTCFGWPLNVVAGANPRSIRDFLMQAHGAEMLRIAACLATERAIPICAPVHDALLGEGSTDEIEDVAARLQQCMREGSLLVLPNFPLRTEAKIVRYPNRFIDPRGREMWQLVSRLLGSIDTMEPPSTDARGPLAPVQGPSILSLSSL